MTRSPGSPPRKTPQCCRDAAEVRSVSWDSVIWSAEADYDLVINLEDDRESSAFVQNLRFGSSLARTWIRKALFDTRGFEGLVRPELDHTFGREKADILKLKNRRAYQELIFEAWDFPLAAKPIMPEPVETGLSGDVAIAPEAGAVLAHEKLGLLRHTETKTRSKRFSRQRLAAAGNPT